MDPDAQQRARPEAPWVTVNPRRIDARVSPVLNETTLGSPPPSMTVVAGPAELRTSIVLPLKSMRSWYVPGATTTVSPSEAASMPAWMVAFAAGT